MEMECKLEKRSDKYQLIIVPRGFTALSICLVRALLSRIKKPRLEYYAGLFFGRINLVYIRFCLLALQNPGRRQRLNLIKINRETQKQQICPCAEFTTRTSN